MNKQTAILITFLIIVTAGLIGLSVYNPSLTSSPQTKIQASLAQTTLSFASPIASASGNFNSNVNIKTLDNKVTAVQIEIIYNKDDLSNVDIAPGSFFKNPMVLLKKIDQENGRISYALGVPFGQKGLTGQGTIATLSFSENVSTKSSTTISFDKKTLVAGEGISSSILKSAAGITFYLASPSAR